MEERETKVKEKSSLKSFLTGAGIYILIFAIVLVASLFCMRALSNTYAFYPVSGTSMQPTINPTPEWVWSERKGRTEALQDSVLVKLTQDIKYNDIVIIQEDPNKDETIIKRVIAMDGDMITILIDNFTEDADGLFHTFVVRAGSEEVERIDESYISQQDLQSWSSYYHYDTTNRSPSSYKYDSGLFNNYLSFQTSDGNAAAIEKAKKVKLYPINGEGSDEVLFYELGDDEIFFMGDHRSVSSDARLRGTACRDEIVGKVLRIIRDSQTFENNGTLWWKKIEALFGVYWENTENYFAW